MMFPKTTVAWTVAMAVFVCIVFAGVSAQAQVGNAPLGASPESDKNISPLTNPPTTSDKKLKKSTKPKKTKKHHRKRSSKGTTESMSGDDVQRP